MRSASSKALLPFTDMPNGPPGGGFTGSLWAVAGRRLIVNVAPVIAHTSRVWARPTCLMASLHLTPDQWLELRRAYRDRNGGLTSHRSVTARTARWPGARG